MLDIELKNHLKNLNKCCLNSKNLEYYDCGCSWGCSVCSTVKTCKTCGRHITINRLDFVLERERRVNV